MRFLPVLTLLLVPAVAHAAMKNQAYELTLGHDGAVTVTHRDGAARTFRPSFVILSTSVDPQLAQRAAGIKGIPYQVPTWKTNRTGDQLGKVDTTVTTGDGFDPDILQGSRDGRVVNCFAAGTVAPLTAHGASIEDGRVRWTFAKTPEGELSATLELPAGSAEPLLRFEFVPGEARWYSVAYVGAPEADPAAIDEMWQPLIWQERRFPDRAYLSPASQGTLPGTLVTQDGISVGVFADPAELPFQPLPTFANSRFGMAVRNGSGKAQPLIVAPILGGPGSKMTAGERFGFAARLTVRRGSCVDTYQAVARGLYGFRDHRRNSLRSLNQTLDNVIAYGLSPYSRFNDELRGCAYDTDVPGSVKNVSALHPLEVALVTDDPEVYVRRARPIMESLLSRERFLFVTDPSIKGQDPSWKLLGPCAPVPELAAMYLVTQQRNPVLLHYTQQLSARSSWTSELALYRATGERQRLESAVRLADLYIEQRMGKRQTSLDYAFFWTSFAPLWADLLELYDETGDKRFLAAATAGAREFAQFVWLCPAIPDTDVTVNPGGKAPEYSYLKKRGLGPMPVPEETVPAWRLSEIGLTPESSGTAGGHRAIFLATYAPAMLRLAYLSNDSFLHDIARSAIVGRSANFPGYHMNTARTTVYEKPNYPLREFRELTYNSFHFNHVWPHAAMLIDYLVSDTFARSQGNIDFPSRYSEGYGYFKSKVYGDRPGKFYDDREVWLWMPRGLLAIDNVQLNYLAARGNGKLYLALTNQSPETVTATLTVNDKLMPLQKGRAYPVRRWPAGETPSLVDGKLTVTVPPMGLAALAIDGVAITPKFQGGTAARASTPALAELEVGGTRGMLLSMGKSYTSAYVYCRSTFEELAEVTLHYRTGGSWQAIRDAKYPFEFTVPLGDDVEAFEFYVQAVDPRGQQQRSESATLRR